MHDSHVEVVFRNPKFNIIDTSFETNRTIFRSWSLVEYWRHYYKYFFKTKALNWVCPSRVTIEELSFSNFEDE